jgi:hypothetical protein
MMMILAEGLPVPGDYQAIGWVCVTVGTIAMGIYYLLKITDRIRGKPAGYEVMEMAQKEFASKHELKRLEKDLIEIGKQREKSSSELHEKINKVALEVAGVLATNNLQNQKLASVEMKVDNVPNRVIEILDRTRHLHK